MFPLAWTAAHTDSEKTLACMPLVLNWYKSCRFFFSNSARWVQSISQNVIIVGGVPHPHLHRQTHPQKSQRSALTRFDFRLFRLCEKRGYDQLLLNTLEIRGYWLCTLCSISKFERRELTSRLHRALGVAISLVQAAEKFVWKVELPTESISHTAGVTCRHLYGFPQLPGRYSQWCRHRSFRDFSCIHWMLKVEMELPVCRGRTWSPGFTLCWDLDVRAELSLEFQCPREFLPPTVQHLDREAVAAHTSRTELKNQIWLYV